MEKLAQNMLSDDHHRAMRVAQNFVGSRSNLEHLESGDAAYQNNEIHLSFPHDE